MLRGDDNQDDSGLNESSILDPDAMDMNPEMAMLEKQKQAREAEDQKRKEDFLAQQEEDDDKFDEKLENDGENARAELQKKNNKVLEQQIESAFDRGKDF